MAGGGERGQAAARPFFASINQSRERTRVHYVASPEGKCRVYYFAVSSVDSLTRFLHTHPPTHSTPPRSRPCHCPSQTLPPSSASSSPLPRPRRCSRSTRCRYRPLFYRTHELDPFVRQLAQLVVKNILLRTHIHIYVHVVPIYSYVSSIKKLKRFGAINMRYAPCVCNGLVARTYT